MFSKIFKTLRLESGMTQIQIAEKFNITQSAVNSWENQGKQPPIETLIELANIFKVSLDYLCGRTEDEFSQSYFSLSDSEIKILAYFKRLNSRAKARALGYLEALIQDGTTSPMC